MKPTASANVAETLNWTKYALAGTALLAAPLASEAAVIVSGPLDIQISATQTSDFVEFDFDNDENADLAVVAFDASDEAAAIRFVLSGGSGQIVGNNFLATALGAGQVIGAGSDFTDKGYLLKEKTGESKVVPVALTGNWPNDISQFRYLGFSFLNSDEQTHYGWLRIAAELGSADFSITDWAYESVAGDPISTPGVPEPSSMALLALGAAGVAALKRRKKANQ